MFASRGTLPGVVVLLRVVLGILIAIAAAIVVIPVFVVFDLVSGGTAFGLCPTGLRTCEPGYFAWAELLGILLLALFVLGAGMALCVRGIRHFQGAGAKYRAVSFE
jgi:hypothetical protein